MSIQIYSYICGESKITKARETVKNTSETMFADVAIRLMQRSLQKWKENRAFFGIEFYPTFLEYCKTMLQGMTVEDIDSYTSMNPIELPPRPMHALLAKSITEKKCEAVCGCKLIRTKKHLKWVFCEQHNGIVTNIQHGYAELNCSAIFKVFIQRNKNSIALIMCDTYNEVMNRHKFRKLILQKQIGEKHYSLSMLSCGCLDLTIKDIHLKFEAFSGLTIVLQNPRMPKCTTLHQFYENTIRRPKQIIGIFSDKELRNKLEEYGIMKTLTKMFLRCT